MTLLRKEGNKLLESAKRGYMDIDPDDTYLGIGRQSGMCRKNTVNGFDSFQDNYHLEPGIASHRYSANGPYFLDAALGRSYALTEKGANIDPEERTFNKEPVFNNGNALANSKQCLLYRLAFIDNPASVYPRFRRRLQSLPVGTMFATTVVFFSVIPVARAADGGDDFANNLFSDLAPILALFGEQVTKQFMSESSGWADNILFAMAPLGIITGIVSAIRVAGHPWLKVLVGRGKEGLAQAELELMSSNSPDVGEMWNGQAIVRVLGKPSIFQFVYTPDEVASDTVVSPSTIVATTASDPPGRATRSDLTSKIDILTNNNIFFERRGWEPPAEVLNDRGRQWDDNIDIEMRPLLRRGEDSDNPHIHEESNENSPPNISLNARGKLIGHPEKWSLAVVGLIAQLVVLIFDSFITYHPRLRTRFLKDDSGPSSQAFSCTIFGTVSLNLGMLVCSYVVDCASTEETWVLKDKSSNCKVAWVQKGETVNDQVFDSYLIFGHEGQQEIKTSQRCHLRSQLKLRFWVLVAMFTSIVGFVTQFIGLRGMHWSATIAQLAATILVTALRSFARRHMTKEPTVSRAVKGYELDSMARKLKGCLGWKVIPEIPHSIPAEQRDKFVQDVMSARKHLENLSDWSVDSQDVASAVCTSMEKCLNYIHQSKDIHLRNSAKRSVELRFTLAALALKDEHPSSPPLATSSHHYGYLPFKLTRPDLSRPWRMSEGIKQEISAVISLWRLHSVEEESYYNKGYILPEGKDLENIHTMAQVLAWPSLKSDQRLFRQWMGSHDIEIRNESPQSIAADEASQVRAHRFIGKLKTGGVPSVAIYSGASIKHLFAQQIFSVFFSEVLPLISEITGLAERILDRHLRHSAISHLVEIISETGLGTRQEILLMIIAHLGDHKLLPPDHESKRACMANFRVERTLRKSRLDNQWDVTASHILKLMGDYFTGYSQDQYNITAHQDLGLFDVLCITQRFVTRICCLLRPDQVGENNPKRPNHTRALFLQWLRDIDINILESLYSPSRHIIYLGSRALAIDELIPNTNQFLDPKMSRKAAILLGKFIRKGGPPWFYNGDHGLYLAVCTAAERFRENMPKELDLLTRIMDFEHKEEELAEVLREATEGGHLSVIEALIDFNPNLRHPESSSLAKVSTRHAGVAHHLLSQLFWYFPVEYRQFQSKQQPALLLNALIEHNDKIMIAELLKHITSSSRDEYRQTCLILAAANGDGSMVAELLKHGANIDRHLPGSYNETWLLAKLNSRDKWMRYQWKGIDGDFVCLDEITRLEPQREGRVDYYGVIKYFLEIGNSNMAICATSVRTALQAAAEQGHIELVKQLLKAGAHVNTAPFGRSWRSALQAAAGGGHYIVVGTLLKAGADVNEEAWGFSGRTALQAAAEGGYMEVVDLLLRSDADVHAKPSAFGRTALQAAAQGGHLKVVDRLLECNADVNDNPAYEGGRTALQAAAEGGNLTVVDRLLQRNADVNAPAQKYGLTPLQAASAGGNLAVVDRLLEQNADLNAQPAKRHGRTALQAAASGGHLVVVDRLLERGADVNAEPSPVYGRTALQAAAAGRHLTVVNRLLGHSANTNAKAAIYGGRTALQAAAEAGDSGLVDRLLVHIDINPDLDKYSGRDALTAAAGGGHLAVVDRLLERVDKNLMSADIDEERALEAAAGGGYIEVVDRLLERAAAASVSFDRFDGQGALQGAAGGGHLAVLDQLLKYADKNAMSIAIGVQTALEAAAGNGSLEVVDRLLGRSVSINVGRDSTWWAIPQKAAEGGHIAVVERLLEHNRNTNRDSTWGTGRTTLQVAAGGGHLELVNRLLDYGADVNAKPGTGGRTALQAAASGGYLAVVDRLIQFGAAVNAKPADIGGLTALQAAARGGHLAVVDLLLKHNANTNAELGQYNGKTALQAAAAGGHLAVVERLLNHGAHVNVTLTDLDNHFNLTVLQAAARGGYLQVVNLLLKHNADVNAKPSDKRGRTALQAAAGGGHLAVVNRLLECNADVNAKPSDKRGRTALQAAAKGGHLAVVNRLLECHADVNGKPSGSGGCTALQAAAGGGHLAVVNRLLECNADVNAKPSNEHGKTALQAAAGGGHLAVVNRLLECHADINAKPSNEQGKTALQAAAGGGHLAVVNRLLECNADANADRAALKEAQHRGHKHVVKRLLAAGAT